MFRFTCYLIANLISIFVAVTKNILYNSIGTGIYTIPDIAHILGLPVGKVSRWMRDYWGSQLQAKRHHTYYQGEGKDRTTNFNTLIEFYVFYQLRELKIGAKKIFDAHAKISKSTGSVYPFANAEILANPKNIFYAMDEEKVIDSKTDQIIYKELIIDFCKKIEFSEDKIAKRFYPAGKNKHIVVDPEHQFGQPIIIGTNVLAENIFSMYESGEDEGRIGKLFDLTLSEVKDAISFYQTKAA